VLLEFEVEGEIALLCVAFGVQGLEKVFSYEGDGGAVVDV
jgi:hypothetical protein